MYGTEGLVQHYERRHRRARLVGYSVAVSSWLAAAFVVAVLKTAPGQSTLRDLLELLAQSAWAGGPILGYVVYARMTKPDGLLLWFRHFWPSHGDRIRFHWVLGRACAGMVYPITVQGGAFRALVMSAVLRVWFLVPLTAFLWGVGLVSLLVAALSVSVDTMSTMLVPLMLAWTVLFLWAGWKLLVRLGFSSLRGDSIAGSRGSPSSSAPPRAGAPGAAHLARS